MFIGSFFLKISENSRNKKILERQRHHELMVNRHYETLQRVIYRYEMYYSQSFCSFWSFRRYHEQSIVMENVDQL